MKAGTNCDGANLILSYPKEHDHIEIAESDDDPDKQDTTIEHPEEVASDDTTKRKEFIKLKKNEISF